MAIGDKYISWINENANKANVNLVYEEADNLTQAQKDMIAGAAGVDGAAMVQAANWNKPADTDFYGNKPTLDPTTEASDEITAITWELVGKNLSYAKFRTLLTAAEKVAIDSGSGLAQADADQCVSYLEDLKAFETDSCLCLDKAEVDTIVNWFETKTLVGAGRAATILAGTLPA